jgi:exonuclease III
MPPLNVDDAGADDDTNDVVVRPFPKITFAAINCNSLNMSATASITHTRKIYGIIKLKADIIFLSDIRLCNRAGVADMQSLCNTLLINPYCSYKIICNSRKNSRGVAILYKNELNLTVLQEERDEDDNLLVVKCLIKDQTVILASIYGPNGTDPAFFTNLANYISRLGDYPVVVGGDWNTTYSGLPLAANPDVVNMANLPNPPNCKSLSSLCRNKKLIDPFRMLWPERLDYSYTPRDVTRLNRSRLDFFLISRDIADSVSECDISPCVQSKLFDHKAVTLSFAGKKPVVAIPTVSPKILNDPDLEIVIKLSVIEIYTRYRTELTEPQTQEILGILGRCRKLLRDAGPDPTFAGGGSADINADTDLRTRNLLVILQNLSGFNILDLQTRPLSIADDEFLEILELRIKMQLLKILTLSGLLHSF